MLRLLEEKDMENCLELMELVKNDFAGYKKEEFIQAMHKAILSKEAFIYYVNEEISGLIAFTYKDKEITFLAVNPKQRKNGIAKKLINQVKKCFKPGDMLQVVTFRENDPKGHAAIGCYKACGFIARDLLEVYGYPCQKMILWL
ncbi:GNAT family N-acetyltransferase [Fusobacterium sp. PH5-44]|uniref:GNAT family N-acetyltransferase n=1 Tax=unclassified Fusobacterium TaxID=2648384 RepID=UPI003D2327D5